jgi:hypothetical protein
MLLGLKGLSLVCKCGREKLIVSFLVGVTFKIRRLKIFGLS